MSADDLGSLGFLADEVVHFGYGAIEDGDFIAVVIHIEDEILAHDGQANQADVTTG